MHWRPGTAARAARSQAAACCHAALATLHTLPPQHVLCARRPMLLEVKGLEAKIAATGQQILKGVNLTVREGEVHAIMGKNGSGKSTLSKVLVGHPDYEVTAGTATFKGQDLFALDPETRSHEGLFLSFQSPIEIPGVSNVDFLRMACNARRKSKGQPELDPLEFYAHVVPKVRRARAWTARVHAGREQPMRPVAAHSVLAWLLDNTMLPHVLFTHAPGRSSRC